MRAPGTVSVRDGHLRKSPNLLRTFKANNTPSWKTNLGQCTACLEASLPKFAGNYGLALTVEANRDRWCQVNTPDKTGAKSALISVGADLTRKFESPLEMFSMTLIDIPYYPGAPQPTPVHTSTKPTASASSSTHSLTLSTYVSTKTSSSSSAPQSTSTGLSWNSLPATSAMVDCSSKLSLICDQT